MFRNIWYDFKKSQIHIWETIKDKRVYDVIDWVPYVFIKDPRGDFKTITGEDCLKKTFRNYFEYNNFQKNNKNILENKVKPEIQFLAERYYEISDDEIEIPFLRIISLDIETEVLSKFPNWKDPVNEINMISVHEFWTNKTITFAFKDYNGFIDSNHKFIKCQNEKDLFLKFFKYIDNLDFDIITGWNVYNFDMTYIIFRSKRIFGEDSEKFSVFSPIKKFSIWEKLDGINIDFPGITILDYMEVYKKFGKKLENFKLDTVCKFVLKKGKVDYSDLGSGSQAFIKLYNEYFDKYVEYNVIDVRRIYELEENLGFISSNILGQSLLTKTPLLSYTSQTKLLEGVMLVYFRRKGLVAPYHKEAKENPYPGAYVNEPQIGFYEWIIDLDITSSYPSHVITLNMSNETFYGRIQNFTKDELLSFINSEFPEFILKKEDGTKIEFKDKRLQSFNKAIKSKLFAIAPCGSIFIQDRIGVIADVQKILFYKRVEVKNELKNYKKLIKNIKNEKEKKEINNKINRLQAFQMAIKTILNATYGATAVSISRYFNQDIATAITSAGVHTVQKAQGFCNDFMNDENIKNEVISIIEKYL